MQSRTKYLVGRGQTLLDEGGCWCHRRPLHPVIGQVRWRLCTHPRFEEFVRPNRRQRRPEQRVSLLCIASCTGGERRTAPRTLERRIKREPMPRFLERIVGQQQPASRPRTVPAAPIDAPATHVILADAAGDHLPVVLPFPKRRQPGGREIWFATPTHAKQAG